jgi:hypothetical protein
MLRLACCLITEVGIAVCAPVHDALLIEAPIDTIETTVVQVQELMAAASEVVLGGFRLRSDAMVVCHPERYMDERGTMMWETTLRILDEVEGTCAPVLTAPAHERNSTCAAPPTCPISYIDVMGGSEI